MSRTPLVHVDRPLAGAGAGEVVALTDQEQHHLRSVLRLRVGDGVEISDGGGRHASGDLMAGGVRLRSDTSSVPRPAPPMHVVHALPKGRKLDEVVRACVELGMDALLPVAADRSVRRPEGARAAKAVVRWTAVARAACEQSRRTYRPSVSPIVAVTDLVVEHRWLLAHPEATESLPEVLGEGTPSGHGDPVTIAVGPEGGWSDAEVDHLVSAGARGVRLGPTVLRTEHAAAAALAVMGAALGRWQPRPFPTP
jgi:16S rRNA (uracil1498-N3)-methyltransferase